MNAQGSSTEVVHDDDEGPPSTGIEAADMSAQDEATSACAMRCECTGSGGRRNHCSDENREHRQCQARVHQTATAVLFALSGPRQFVPAAGVIVYCQLPAGTPFSTQVRALIVPEQALPMVWTTPVGAL